MFWNQFLTFKNENVSHENWDFIKMEAAVAPALLGRGWWWLERNRVHVPSLPGWGTLSCHSPPPQLSETSRASFIWMASEFWEPGKACDPAFSHRWRPDSGYLDFPCVGWTRLLSGMVLARLAALVGNRKVRFCSSFMLYCKLQRQTHTNICVCVCVCQTRKGVCLYTDIFILSFRQKFIWFHRYRHQVPAARRVKLNSLVKPM